MLDDIGQKPGHFLIVLKDAERLAYHSVIRIDETGLLTKVSGPDQMPGQMSQKIIDKILKYNTAAKKLEIIPTRTLSNLMMAVTLAVKRKGQ